jgi:inorganic triphosphatase YgiF
MTGREQTEIERKYDVDESSRIPDLAIVTGVGEVVPSEPVTLTAVYYDTATHDLARHRIVLRRREGGGDAGWHIKLPAAEGRTELHWPLDLSDGEVPAGVLEPVRAIVRDRPLTPLARITTVRTAIRLHGADGAELAEVADDAVSASDARGGTYRKWREWEVELLDGAPDTPGARTHLLDAIEKVVLGAGARPSSSVAKIARALGVDSLTEVAPPTVLPGLLPAPALNDPDSAAVVVVGAVRELADELRRTDPLARADAGDAIHRMRTTVRRLRSVLVVYSRVFEKPAVADLSAELEQLGVELGRARDAEVRGRRAAAELAEASHPNADAEIRLVGGARLDYADALERARAYLLSSRYYRLLDALDAFADRPPLTEKAARPASAEIRRDLGKAIAAVGTVTARVADSHDPEAALHDVRRAVRRLWFAAEAVATAEPVAPEPVPSLAQGTAVKKKATKKARKKAKARRKAAAARFAKRRRRYAEIGSVAKPLVKRLGTRHDRLLYIAELGRAAEAAHTAGENTLLYGLLIARAEDLDDTVTVAVADVRRSLHRLKRLGRAL